MKENVIPGATVLIRSHDKGDWTAMFGATELGKDTPPSVDDYWRIASNTKMYTSTVIFQLVQEGKLELDDPVSTSLPAPTDTSIPNPHPQGYSFGTNVSTIETFALPPDQQAAAVAGTLKPTNHTNDNPGVACRELDRAGSTG